MKYLRQFSVALGIAYLSLLAQFKHIYEPYNHFLDPWHVGFASAILCAVLAWTILFWSAYFIVANLSRLLPAKWKILRPVAIAVVLSYVFLRPLIALSYDKLIPPLLQVCVDTPSLRWVYYLPVILLSAFFAVRCPEKTMRVFRRLGHVFAILFLLNVATALTWPRFPYPSDPVIPESWRAEVPSENKKLIFIVMDEWSYHRTFVRDDLPERFPNLARWLATSTFYTNAYSPGSSTPFAIPRILFGSGTKVPGFWNQDMRDMILSARPPNDLSIFSVPPYDSALRIVVGGFLFYPVLLANDQMDVCVRLDTPLSRRTFGSTFFSLFLNPLSSLATRCGIHTVAFDHESFPQMEVPIFAREVLTSLPEGKNAQIWLHHLVPHFPFRNKAGALISHKQDWPPEVFFDAHAQILADYEESMELMDYFLGEWEAFWKERGEWDNACVILLSDHEWRGDPDHSLFSRFRADNSDNEATILQTDGMPEILSWQHIPLIIKYPRQNNAAIVAERVYARDLHRLVSAYWESSEPSMDKLRAWPFVGGQ